MKKLILTLVILGTTAINAGWDAQGMESTEQRKLRLETFQKEQEKRDAAKQKYLPIAAAFQTALNSDEVQKQIQKFKDNVAANAKSIATTLAEQINLSAEQVAQLNAILSEAYNLTRRIAEVGGDQNDAKIEEIRNKLNTELEPLIYAIDDTFKIQETLMNSAIQGKAPAADTVKAGAEQLAQIIQSVMDAIKAKSAPKK